MSRGLRVPRVRVHRVRVHRVCVHRVRVSRVRVQRVCAWLLGMAAWFAAVLTSWPAVVHAHPIHTTYAEVQVEGAQVTITVRAFADDLAAAVARFNGRAVPRDSAVPPADLSRYLDAMLQVHAPSGAAVSLRPCGIRRAETLTYVCVQASWAVGARVTNRLLTDLHADQVNVMQQRGGRTWLFTRADATQSLR